MLISGLKSVKQLLGVIIRRSRRLIAFGIYFPQSAVEAQDSRPSWFQIP